MGEAIPVDPEVLRALNEHRDDGHKIRLYGDVCPFCRKIYADLLEQHDGDWKKVMEHIKVKRLILSEKDRRGIAAQPFRQLPAVLQIQLARERLQSVLEMRKVDRAPGSRHRSATTRHARDGDPPFRERRWRAVGLPARAPSPGRASAWRRPPPRAPTRSARLDPPHAEQVESLAHRNPPVRGDVAPARVAGGRGAPMPACGTSIPRRSAAPGRPAGLSSWRGACRLVACSPGVVEARARPRKRRQRRRFRVNLIWLSRTPMTVGKDYKLKLHTIALPVRIHAINRVDYFTGAGDFLWWYGLAKGRADGTYGPLEDVSRAAFATRCSGTPGPHRRLCVRDPCDLRLSADDAWRHPPQRRRGRARRAAGVGSCTGRGGTRRCPRGAR